MFLIVKRLFLKIEAIYIRIWIEKSFLEDKGNYTDIFNHEKIIFKNRGSLYSTLSREKFSNFLTGEKEKTRER